MFEGERKAAPLELPAGSPFAWLRWRAGATGDPRRRVTSQRVKAGAMGRGVRNQKLEHLHKKEAQKSASRCSKPEKTSGNRA